MNIKIPLHNSELIFSKDEYGFQDVLNNLSNTNNVIVVTYNISNKSDKLLNLIKNLSSNIKVTIITNIPKRFDSYKVFQNYDPRASARKNIKMYLSKIDKRNFNLDFSPYFNFGNHAKIIMTDNIAYLGSQNFSDESSQNFECGVLIKDIQAIKEIQSKIISYMITNSIPYGGTELDNYICSIKNLLDDLWDVRMSISENSATLNDDETADKEEMKAGSLYEQDLCELISILNGIEIIMQELSEKNLYKSINTESLEIVDIKYLINNSAIQALAQFNEVSERVELLNRYLNINQRKELKSLISESVDVMSLSNDDKEKLVLIHHLITGKKEILYKSALEDIKDLITKLESLYLNLETIFDNLIEMNRNEDIIDNTN